ncbi:YdcP family protein [Enterococcus hirae]|nr:YdcP family protein [Enterococcus hirae]
MPKKNELNAGMEIDSQETFGELLFLRMKSAKTEIDEDTGQRQEVARRYVVQSSKQLAEEIITVPIETPLREFVAGDKVEIVNPTTNLYAFGNGNYTNSYIQVFAEDIRKVSEPASAKVQNDQKNQKDNQNK